MNFPKTVIDEPKYLIDINKDHVDILRKTSQLMKNKLFDLCASESGVFLNIRDGKKEDFTIKISEADNDIVFNHRYLTQPFVKLINKDKSFTISEKGMLKATINGFDFNLLPQ